VDWHFWSDNYICDALRYILDPQDVHGADFPGETFRVLKEKEVRLYGEYRTRRLVLEAWDALEGTQVNGYTGKQVSVESNQLSVTSNQLPVDEKVESRTVEPPAKAAPVVKEEPAPAAENPAQPMLSDFGLYKCVQCGKMVMGYEKDVHVAEVHQGKSVEWKRIK
jgi:hypothetical protein